MEEECEMQTQTPNPRTAPVPTCQDQPPQRHRPDPCEHRPENSPGFWRCGITSRRGNALPGAQQARGWLRRSKARTQSPGRAAAPAAAAALQSHPIPALSPPRHLQLPPPNPLAFPRLLFGVARTLGDEPGFSCRRQEPVGWVGGCSHLSATLLSSCLVIPGGMSAGWHSQAARSNGFKQRTDFPR